MMAPIPLIPRALLRVESFVMLLLASADTHVSDFVVAICMSLSLLIANMFALLVIAMTCHHETVIKCARFAQKALDEKTEVKCTRFAQNA